MNLELATSQDTTDIVSFFDKFPKTSESELGKKGRETIVLGVSRVCKRGDRVSAPRVGDSANQGESLADLACILFKAGPQEVDNRWVY